MQGYFPKMFSVDFMFIHVCKNQQKWTMLRKELQLRRIVNWKEGEIDWQVKFSAWRWGSQRDGRRRVLLPSVTHWFCGQWLYCWGPPTAQCGTLQLLSSSWSQRSLHLAGETWCQIRAVIRRLAVTGAGACWGQRRVKQVWEKGQRVTHPQVVLPHADSHFLWVEACPRRAAAP